MMKIILTVLLLLTFSLSFSQVGTITTRKGKVIGIYNESIQFTGEYLIYLNKKGKLKWMKQKKIKSLEFGDTRYLKLPIFSFGASRLHVVIAENDDYLLTSYFSNSHYLYIFRKSDMKVQQKYLRYSVKKKEDNKRLEVLKPYFKNCSNLLQKIKSNIDGIDYKHPGREGSIENMFEGISNYQCK